MKRNIIKVGFCVAYDWELLKKAVPRVYEYADTIVFSIDKNRRSWSGNTYSFDESTFHQFLLEIDVDKKIKVYEDDFFIPELTPIENDNRQRNLMAKQMGEGGWHIQIDSDEYFIDFKGFREYLLKLIPSPSLSQKPINVSVNLVPLLKKLPNGYLYVDFKLKNRETAPFATNMPIYNAARRNGHFNHLSPFLVIHETWARSEQELYNKIQSWGHKNDFNKESYFNLWKALDEHNCSYIHNFHPVEGEAWEKLAYAKGRTIDELIQFISLEKSLQISQVYLFWKNARNWQRIKAQLKKIVNQ